MSKFWSNNCAFQWQNSVTDVSVTLRPPCLCPSEGHKHGVSKQSSVNLGDTLLQITREWKTAETWFLARLFIYQSSIVSQTLDFFHRMVTIFIWSHDWWKPRIVRVSVHYVDFFVFFVLRHWWVSQVLTPIMSPIFIQYNPEFSNPLYSNLSVILMGATVCSRG